MAKKKGPKGIEKIKEKITSDANREIKKVKDTAKQEVKKLQGKRQQEGEAYKERFQERTKMIVESYKQKTLAQARLDVKKAKLQEREQLIEEILGEVVKELDRKSAGYERFLKNILKENMTELHGSITITCNKADVALAGKLSPKAKVMAGEIAGGLIIEDSTGKRVDESLEAVIERRQDEIRQEIAAIMNA